MGKCSDSGIILSVNRKKEFIVNKFKVINRSQNIDFKRVVMMSIRYRKMEEKSFKFLTYFRIAEGILLKI